MDAFSNPKGKTWWAKRLVGSEYYTAGQLTARQLKYAMEDQFKSIVALHYYENSCDKVLQAGEYFPSTKQAVNIVNMTTGVEYHVVLKKGEDWTQSVVFKRLGDIVANAPKPLLFYSNTQEKAVFMLLLSFTRTHRPCSHCDDMPKISVHELFIAASNLGFNFDKENYADLISNITKVKIQHKIYLNLAITDWYKTFWPAKPIENNWYVAGQISNRWVKAIKKQNFKTILNFRQRFFPDTRVPEGVSLLNVKDKTEKDKDGLRQTTARLLQHRIDPLKSNKYISENSTVNYESRNFLEYGDSVGYNETKERLSIEKLAPGITYVHMPIGE